MLLFRIGATRYANVLSGEGAKLFGGRWNHPGTGCIYTAESRSLALLEYTAHARIDLIPRNLSFVTIDVPDTSIMEFSEGDLPGNWKQFPHPNETRNFMTKFLKENKHLIYKIPSAIIDEEWNYLINPAHKKFDSVHIVEIKDYSYDLRLKRND
jgi:RES domain-containing protein